MPLLINTIHPNFQNPMSSSFTIKYQVPYPTAPLLEEWRTESFTTKDKAEERIKYYKSCGSLASFI